ncbi:MAG: xanthine dehydrogenase family protein molybdopterin-binding subunit [Pseudolabrys sp.]
MTFTVKPRPKTDPRIEDDALVRGAGQFVNDPRLPEQAFAAFTRSPHASARVTSIDTSAAKSAKGVIAVLTAADMAGLNSCGKHPPLPGGKNGMELIQPFRPVLAGERVTYVGEAVAMVVAETALQAQDAADMVTVDYEETPAVVDILEAQKSGAPQVHKDAPGNLAFDWAGMVPTDDNEREIDAIIKSAAHVAKVSVINQRMVVASMETRGATGVYDAKADSYTLYCCSQSAGMVRNQTAPVFNVPPEKMRVVTNDVGGAFGMKTPVYPEYAACLVAAKKTGRPVHWMSSRTEAFLTDNQARDTVTDVELALDDKGKFLAVRMRHTAAQGAYITPAGVGINTNNVARCLPGMYRIPKIVFTAKCIFTNTAPIGPYRGAGRPEANYALERAVEEAARITGIDKVRLRRQNLIPPSSMPYKTAVTTTYDSGDFPAILKKALELHDHAGFNKRKRDAARRKKWLGFGVSCMLEHAGALPTESGSLAFDGDTLIMGCNVQSTGQSHATVFGRMVAQKLGIDQKHITHRHGDSAMNLPGFASVGSRSAMAAGSALFQAADTVIAKGKKAAAALLEASEADIQYGNGYFSVVGTDRRISLFETAKRAKELVARGEIKEGLDTMEKRDTPLTFPNGVHLAEVEIDPDTGKLAIARYTAVDDCGNMLDPIVVEGQVHGSLVQGFGQALMENAVYDPQGGQMLTASFMDYAMPKAHDLPLDFREAVHPVPATTNPLGVKGTGEAGTTASIAALMNAVSDAIPNGAADYMDMPATPAKIWEACQRAQK